MKLCTHVIHDMILCLRERHHVLLFIFRVVALDINKWKIIHVSQMVGILYRHGFYNIVVIDLIYTPDDFSRCWGQGQRLQMHYIIEMDNYLQKG
jgi:hypothetical protein